MTSYLSKLILKILGWKQVGDLPDLKKYIVIAAPHTSNWDYIIGRLFYLSRGVDSKIMIKKELFWFPLGPVLTALGGIPVDRNGNTDIVDQMIRQFQLKDNFILTITPEGTRQKVTEWKTGFHRIATGARVPVLQGFFDYEKKLVGTGELLYMTDDIESDMLRVRKFYCDKVPKYPEKFSV